MNIDHYDSAGEYGCESIGAALHILVHQMGSISEISVRGAKMCTDPGVSLLLSKQIYIGLQFVIVLEMGELIMT